MFGDGDDIAIIGFHHDGLIPSVDLQKVMNLEDIASGGVQDRLIGFH